MGCFLYGTAVLLGTNGRNIKYELAGLVKCLQYFPFLPLSVCLLPSLRSWEHGSYVFIPLLTDSDELIRLTSGVAWPYLLLEKPAGPLWKALSS